MHKFDFVVVGAGSAGCTVASRLSENGKYQVALLEAGGSHNNPLISIPFNFAFTVPKGPHNWSFETVPQEGLNRDEAVRINRAARCWVVLLQ